MKIFENENRKDAYSEIRYLTNRFKDLDDSILAFNQMQSRTKAFDVMAYLFWAYVNNSRWLSDFGYASSYFTNMPKENPDGQSYTLKWENESDRIKIVNYAYGKLRSHYSIILVSSGLSTSVLGRFENKQSNNELVLNILYQRGHSFALLVRTLLPSIQKARLLGEKYFDEYKFELHNVVQTL